jgi:hypothetical protein
VPGPALRLCFDVDDDLLAAARQCESDVFDSAYGNTPDELEKEYGRYDDTSLFIALADDDNRVMGTCRVILPSAVGLKTVVDLSGAPWHLDGLRSARAAQIDLETTWDVATLGIRSELGRSGIMAAAALYHGLVAGGRANGATTMITIIDERVRKLLHSIGLATNILPGAFTAPYLGSAASTPCFAHLAAVVDNQRRATPDAYRLITMGQGLAGVRVPGPQEFRMRPRGRVIDLPDRQAQPAPREPSQR